MPIRSGCSPASTNGSGRCLGANPTVDPAAAHSGTHVLGTIVTGTGVYPPHATTAITTPAFDATLYDQVRLQYWRWLSVEDGRYDHAEIQVGGTAPWSNAKSAAGTLNHLDKEWRFHDVDLTPMASAQTTVTWSLASDPSGVRRMEPRRHLRRRHRQARAVRRRHPRRGRDLRRRQRDAGRWLLGDLSDRGGSRRCRLLLDRPRPRGPALPVPA